MNGWRDLLTWPLDLVRALVDDWQAAPRWVRSGLKVAAGVAALVLAGVWARWRGGV